MDTQSASPRNQLDLMAEQELTAQLKICRRQKSRCSCHDPQRVYIKYRPADLRLSTLRTAPSLPGAMTTQERMKNGELYFCNSEELMREQAQCLEKLYDFNHTKPGESERRQQLLGELLAEVGENCYVEPPLRASWGRNTHFGNNVYANFNLTLVDDTDIHVGDNVMFAPNVVVATAAHPIEPELRRKVAQFNLPVRIGANVWIGAGAILLPGVTIGENTVIGAGSVVTKDIPANVVAVGNPCRVLREINDTDREFYAKGRRINLA